MDIETIGKMLAASIATLIGVATFIAAALNFAKSRGWLPDGQAPKWTLILNLFFFVVIAIVQLAGFGNYVPIIDKAAGIVAQILALLTVAGTQLFLTRAVHVHALRGLPGIGFSHSINRSPQF